MSAVCRALPVQPLYEAIEQSTTELLQLLKRANLATVLSHQIQKASSIVYDMPIPKQLTEDWVEKHVHKVFVDDHDALRTLRSSVVSNDPATKLNKLVAYQPNVQKFYGYVLRVPVQKKDNTIYQDGSAVTGQSVKLYHSTRQGLLHDIFKNGIQASIPSHKTEGRLFPRC